MRPALATLLLLAFAAPVHALEQTAGLKVTPLLKTTSSWNGAPLAYPTGTAEVSGLLIEIPAGGETGWHSHPVPSFAYVLEGELEVSLQNGKQHRIRAGEALAEVVDVQHNGRNVGPGPVRLVVFYTGAAGTALTETAAQ